ncbi:hypothetical protein [Pistricoccus aurantiacus]|uniref:Uncharacterized protein n=1 Tax=Pistricoccus aurantiacus TaxID=1883414 RepID=A0A5B8ST18_9GAMM|nr:hypothetical protein [Pistricoccus aurantiacus]QEA37818.1 hypothetical protein FGL86_01185 [Pistricoccus aurantiacus]
MLHDTIKIRQVDDEYEVYDTDTGTSLGMYGTEEEAEAMRKSQKKSQDAVDNGGEEADPEDS